MLCKLAYDTPPLVMNCGKAIGSFLKYQSFVDTYIPIMEQALLNEVFNPLK